ncbi:MAG TPA: SNF2-related protein [Terriglobia bacterium]|nr:SNF2-related protein [Terriglobia bacterium]
MLVEEQISARQLRARSAIQTILARPAGHAYGDYEVKSSSGKKYRVAMRGPSLFENFCSCADFSVNTLGTCKHIEGLLLRLRQRFGRSFDRQKYHRTRASLSLQYGEELGVLLRLPTHPSPGLKEIGTKYFDPNGLLQKIHLHQFEQILENLRAADETAVVYSDVLDYVDRENELAVGLKEEQRHLAKLAKGKNPLPDLLKATLFPFQIRGALFAASRGRVILADDMGLGKTIQAIAAAELLRLRRGIARVLVVAPASVKYQWKNEIEKFCAHSAQVIDGPLPRRKQLYAHPSFFNLTSYELVMKDLDDMRNLRPDLIIVDEAQRIRNWATATARAVKQLKSRYAFVLTGTPLENKLEELYSVVEFVDGRRLGPAFRFLKEHRIEDEKGKLLGYRGLERIHQQLKPILLRRTRKEVLPELPPRTDQIYRVRMTEEQAGPYHEQSEILARLMHKWQRQGWLSEIDLRRITCCIQNMRMLCNSTFLFDQATNFSPKLEEFREIIRELVIEEERKVVVFSEYERMTRLVSEALTKLKIKWVSLHGGVPARKRGELIARFSNDADCKVFLSTDAGGVGLNLQVASAVVNFEPPWNPARLEQRIGRVHRYGQAHPVQVVHLLTENSIEERVWETMKLKKALFASLFESTADEVSFEKLGRKSMMQVINEVFCDPIGPQSPAAAREATVPATAALPTKDLEKNVGEGPAEISEASTAALPVTGAFEGASAAQVSGPQALSESTPTIPDAGHAVAKLFEAGLNFLESISVPRTSVVNPPQRQETIHRALSHLFQNDAQTQRPVLSIPLPDTFTAERLAGAIEGLLERFAGAS